MNQAGLKMMAAAYQFPASMKALGLEPAAALRKVRRLMLGTDGLTNTGKTEFGLSAPGPKVVLPLDTSYDSVLDNPLPPAERRLHDTAFDNIKIPMLGTTKQDNYIEYFKKYRNRLYDLLDNPDIRTIIMDGDSDSWELQLLAEFGRNSQIHPLQYQAVDAARRAMIKRCWESGKIIISTNKLKDMYEDVMDPATGLPMKDDKGKVVQRKVKGEYKRQGFRDQNYLWQIQIRHLYRAPEQIDLSGLSPAERLKAVREKRTKTEPQWGIRILKCKPNTRLEGDELWGEHCNFKGLVTHIYPSVPLTEWGYESDS